MSTLYVIRNSSNQIIRTSTVAVDDFVEAVDSASPEVVAFNGTVAASFAGPDLSDSNNLPKAMKAMLLVMSAWSSKTPVQAKAAFLAAWNALP